MRLIPQALVAIMLVAILGGIMRFNRLQREDLEHRATARREVARFQQQVLIQSAMTTERSYPQTIEISWFRGDVPRNPVLDPSRPWLEIAGMDEADRLHPIQPMAATEEIAEFWYNPWRGIVRARVPAGLNDTDALDLYNFINDSSLSNLFASAGSDDPH